MSLLSDDPVSNNPGSVGGAASVRGPTFIQLACAVPNCSVPHRFELYCINFTELQWGRRSHWSVRQWGLMTWKRGSCSSVITTQSAQKAPTLVQSLHWLLNGRTRQRSQSCNQLFCWRTRSSNASLSCFNPSFMTFVIYCIHTDTHTHRGPPVGPILLKTGSMLLNTCEPQYRPHSSPSFPVHQSGQHSRVTTKRGEFCGLAVACEADVVVRLYKRQLSRRTLAMLMPILCYKSKEYLILENIHSFAILIYVWGSIFEKMSESIVSETV